MLVGSEKNIRQPIIIHIPNGHAAAIVKIMVIEMFSESLSVTVLVKSMPVADAGNNRNNVSFSVACGSLQEKSRKTIARLSNAARRLHIFGALCTLDKIRVLFCSSL